MNSVSRLIVALVVTAVSASIAFGAKPAAKAPPLPEWAPKKPSKEFLRAARVLKPLTEDALRKIGQGGNEAIARGYVRSLPAAYEFFGLFSDKQIKRFVSRTEEKKKLLVSFRSLTPTQEKAFRHWYDRWRASRLDPDAPEDYRVDLYKRGAREDLSNARVGFVAVGRMVCVLVCFTGKRGRPSGACSHFAML